MPATPARAAFASREFLFDTRSDVAIKDLHPAARDQSETPAVSFFVDLAVAAAINAERATLLMALPQRIAVTVAAPLISVDTSQITPAVHLTDAEAQVDHDFLMARLVVDLENETTALELFRGG